MRTIIFDKTVRNFIEASPERQNLIIRGPTGCGKTTALRERYRYMVEKLGIPGEKILVLVYNKHQVSQWRLENQINYPVTSRVTSYFGFVQEEISLYYPLILKRCSDILNKRLEPVFLNFDVSQFLISKVVQWKRENKGFFGGVTANTASISADLTMNLLKAASSCIPYSEIGERLYNSLQLKNDEKRFAYAQADEILEAYRKKCIELGIFDLSIAIDLFNDILLKDDTYKQQLNRRVSHLIVDNFEESTPALANLVDFLLPNTEICLLGYNFEGGYSEASGIAYDRVRKWTAGIDSADNEMSRGGGVRFDVLDLEKSRTCSPFMYEFSDMLFDNMLNFKGHKLQKDKQQRSKHIERTPASELRSEMLEEIGLKICDLVYHEGYKPDDIAVLSTYADPVTEFVIRGILGKQSLRLENVSRSNRFMDNVACQVLMTLARLCYPRCGIYPNVDDIRILIGRVMKLDPVRRSLLAGAIYNEGAISKLPKLEDLEISSRMKKSSTEKYRYLREWIIEYREMESNIPIDEFLSRAFLEVVVSEDTSQEDIREIDQLINSARKFINAISGFSSTNATKGFIESVISGMKSGDTAQDNDGTDKARVLMAVPSFYLASPLRHKVIILSSISSKNWCPRNAREMTNPYVLTKTWDKAGIYSEAIEQNYRLSNLALVMRAILKRCGEKLITFQSRLSANGFENDGILAEYFDEILEGSHGA